MVLVMIADRRVRPTTGSQLLSEPRESMLWVQQVAENCGVQLFISRLYILTDGERVIDCRLVVEAGNARADGKT
jgi:hypothetical protein